MGNGHQEDLATPDQAHGTDADRADGMTRRRLLGVGGQAVFIAAAGGVLAACGSSTSSTATSGGGGKPVKGGAFKMALVASGPESLQPSALTMADIARSAQLYDNLFDWKPGQTELVPMLALSAEPNKDASVWTFKLRDGVEWHDGKPFTADDVVYTIKSWESPKTLNFGFVGLVDFKKVRKLDKLTVEVPLVAPMAQFPSMLAVLSASGMTQDGASFAQLNSAPVGTGPFKFKSFKQGHSEFLANDNYWDGPPYVDKVLIDSNFTDEQARLNAFLSGNYNLNPDLPALIAKQQESSSQMTVLRSHSSTANEIYFDVSKPPFDDSRVTQAMRLMIDRQELIDQALLGYATLGNDLIGVGLEYYATDLKRHQDVEQAQSLLKQAGQEGLSFTMSTSEAVPGAVGAATVFAQQAKQIDVDVQVQKVSPTNYFSPAGGYPYPVGQSQFQPFPSLGAAYKTALFGYNETQADLESDRTLMEALATLDRSRAGDLWHEAQERQFNEGGNIFWSQGDLIDGIAPNVEGVQTTAVWYLDNFNLKKGWIAS